jgi:hypothetical protein
MSERLFPPEEVEKLREGLRDGLKKVVAPLLLPAPISPETKKYLEELGKKPIHQKAA